MLRSPALTASETRHVNTGEHISLIWNPPVNININLPAPIPSRIATPCGTGLCPGPGATRRWNASHECPLVGERYGFARRLRAAQVVWSKGYEKAKVREVDTSNTIGTTDTLVKSDRTTYSSDVVPVLGDLSGELFGWVNGVGTSSDSPVGVVFSGSRLSSFVPGPEVLCGIGRKDTAASSGSLGKGCSYFFEAGSVPTIVLDPIPISRFGQLGQLSKSRSRVCLVGAYTNLIQDVGGCRRGQHPQKTMGLLGFVTAASARFCDFLASVATRDAGTQSTCRENRAVGGRAVRAAMFSDRSITEGDSSRSGLVVLGGRCPTLDCGLRLMGRIVGYSDIAKPAALALRPYCPSRCNPPKPAAGFVYTTTKVRRQDIVRPSLGSLGFNRASIALPLIGMMARSFAVRLYPRGGRGMLVLGSSFLCTLAGHHDESTISSEFDYPPRSSQIPNGIYSSLEDKDSTWSNLDPGFNLHNLPAQESVSGPQNVTSLFGQGSTTSCLTPVYNPANAVIPQQHGFSQAHPAPNNASSEQSDHARHDYSIPPGVMHNHAWLLPTVAGSAHGQGTPYYPVTSVPSNPPSKRATISLPGRSINPSYASASGARSWSDALGQPMGPPVVDDPFQTSEDPSHAPFGPEHQFEAAGFRTAANPAIACQPSAVLRTPGNQAAYDEGHLASNERFPGHATNFASTSALVVVPGPFPALDVPPKSGHNLEIAMNPGHNGGRKHTCPTCQRSYRRPYLLRDHMKTHSDEANDGHPCENAECNSTFATRSNMKRHYNQKHKATSDPSNPPSVAQHDDQAEATSGCTVIEETSSQASVVAQHPTDPPADLVEGTSARPFKDARTFHALDGLSPSMDGYADQFLDNFIGGSGHQSIRLPRNRLRRSKAPR